MHNSRRAIANDAFPSAVSPTMVQGMHTPHGAVLEQPAGREDDVRGGCAVGHERDGGHAVADGWRARPAAVLRDEDRVVVRRREAPACAGTRDTRQEAFLVSRPEACAPSPSRRGAWDREAL